MYDTGYHDHDDDDIRVVVAIDFGTTYSGYAFAHKFDPKNIIVQDKWMDTIGYKTPTIIKYQDETFTTIKSWGYSAMAKKPTKKNSSQLNVELFKLLLLNSSSMEPILPDNLDHKKVITDYLERLCDMIKKSLSSRWKDLHFYSNVLTVFTIPAEFDDDAIKTMRECAFAARFTNDKFSRNLVFTTEPEAAAVYCLDFLKTMYKLKPGDSFMVVDSGGGTVDLSRHEILTNNGLSELTERTGESCGSSFIDKKFIEFLGNKLGVTVIEKLNTDYKNLLQHFVQEFGRRAKIPFTGRKSDFRDFRIDLDDFPWIKGIIEGEEKRLLRRDNWTITVRFNDVKEMFDPIIQDIINLIREQLEKDHAKCSAIMFVGGFGESKYLLEKIRREFKDVPIITEAPNPIVAVVKGGVQFGLNNEIVVNRVLKRTYGTDIVRRSLPSDPPTQRLPNGYTIIFETLARRGSQVSTNEKVTKYYKPSSLTQSNISFDMYVTDRHIVKFCDDPEVKLLRNWEIESEIDNYDDDTTIIFTLNFGTVEILATAEKKNGKGKKDQITFKCE
ncbi:1057_t:CDS:2 [Funneliformis geosporum]|uniref:11389_t:CDS:1 n=1 Tax=Funneliformis geosporum TaxID=1117311 RepID=A0A9W4WYC0_9GLOM|nr:1057_t:CDS:2 [Funneliformis geosporum]CAI2172718.1 11389_t:CDS:2 [Funneliformis geosporum]